MVSKSTSYLSTDICISRCVCNTPSPSLTLTLTLDRSTPRSPIRHDDGQSCSSTRPFPDPPSEFIIRAPKSHLIIIHHTYLSRPQSIRRSNPIRINVNREALEDTHESSSIDGFKSAAHYLPTSPNQKAARRWKNDRYIITRPQNSKLHPRAHYQIDLFSEVTVISDLKYTYGRSSTDPSIIIIDRIN